LDGYITRIEKLHHETLNAPDPTAAQAELDSLVASTSSLINTIKSNLDRLGDDAKKGGSDAQRKVTLVNSQRKRLQERVQRFQKVEKQYRDRIRERTIRQYRIVNPDVTEEELSIALSDPNTQIFQQALMSSTRQSQAQATLREVQSRHNDIVAIERKVSELAQLFNELNVMIDLAEVTIDHINQDAENTRAKMEEGNKEVSRANRYAAAVRRKKWWCLLIVLLIIAVIVIAVVVTQVVNRNNNNSTSSTSNPSPTSTITTTPTATL